jgi:hypothetical protein
MMRRGAIKVSGAVGALPAWIDYAKGMMEVLKYRDQIDELDLSIVKRGEWPIKYPANASSIGVDLARGIVFSSDNAGEEVFATTNIDKTGESFENEFAIGSTVRSIIRVPGDGRGNVARLYSPFNFKAELKDTSTPAAPARVEVTDKPGVSPDTVSDTANSQLLPGLRPGEVPGESQEVLDDDGRIIRSEKDSSKSPVTGTSPPGDDSGIDVNGQAKPDSDKAQKPENGDLW